MVSGIKAIDTQRDCCRKTPEYISNFIDLADGTKIGVVKTSVTFGEKIEHLKCRFGKFRDNYKVPTGLYAVNSPNEASDVFVSANYKLSFDILRENLSGLNCWILVLDTRGINVWCAAGKGTFGTRELISKIKSTKLSSIINHWRIIVPQLGAVGISYFEVEEKTGFKVIFGPIRAADISSFLNHGYFCSKKERLVDFPLLDRALLVPMEFYNNIKWLLFIIIITVIAVSLDRSGLIFVLAYHYGIPLVCLIIVSYLIGTVGVPLFLPFIPFRSFAMKGEVLGLLTPVIAISMSGIFPIFSKEIIIFLSWIFCPAYSSYLALQFTGCSTYTSISGVKKELKIAIPIYFSVAAVSIMLLIVFITSEWIFIS